MSLPDPSDLAPSGDPSSSGLQSFHQHIDRFLQDAAPDPLLDSKEITVVPTWESSLRAQVGEQSKSGKFTHSGWSSTRERVIASLFRTKQSDRRILSFMSCGNAAWIERAKLDQQRYRLRVNSCRDKLCQVCGGCRSRRISQRLADMMEGKRCRFITLTLCGTTKDKLATLVQKLYRSFRYLRSHPLWEGKVEGGCAFLEIKYSEKSKRWHPHLHIIAEGRFLPQSELSDAWRSITKDSYIVDVSDASSGRAANYVSKYASKPLNTSFSHSPALLDEAVTALFGRRLVTCFGTWYGTPISNAEDEELADDEVDAGGYHMMMGIEELFAQAAAGHGDSLAMIRCVPGAYERYVFWLNTS